MNIIAPSKKRICQTEGTFHYKGFTVIMLFCKRSGLYYASAWEVNELVHEHELEEWHSAVTPSCYNSPETAKRIILRFIDMLVSRAEHDIDCDVLGSPFQD
jgi:hypothetical protein